MCGTPPPQVPLTPSFLSSLPQNLLFSVCGLTICAAIICTLSAIVCCIQIFSLDLVHTVRGARGKAREAQWEARVCVLGLGSRRGGHSAGF